MKKVLFETGMSVVLAIVLVMLGCSNPTDPATAPSETAPETPSPPANPDFTLVTGTFGSAPAGSVSASEATDWSQYEVWAYSWSSMTSFWDKAYEAYYAGEEQWWEVYPVASDGSFEAEIPIGETFVAFLAEPSASGRSVVGMIGIGTGSGSTWDAIDTAYTGNILDLGTLSDTDGTYASQYGISSVLTDAGDLEAVVLMSRLDDMVRMLENVFNYSFFDFEYREGWVFGQSWTGYDGEPGDWNLSGGQWYLFWDSPVNGTTEARLYPPEDVTLGNDPETAVVIGPTGDRAYEVANEATEEGMYNDRAEWGKGEDGSSLFQAPIPDGYYTVRDDQDATIGEFRGGAAPPLLDDGRIAILIPTLDFVTENGDGTGRILYIDIAFWTADPNGSGYVEVPIDRALMLTEWPGIELSDFGGFSDENGVLESYRPQWPAITDARYELPAEFGDWYLTGAEATADPDGNGHWAEYAGASTGGAGMGYRFAIRN